MAASKSLMFVMAALAVASMVVAEDSVADTKAKRDLIFGAYPYAAAPAVAYAAHAAPAVAYTAHAAPAVAYAAHAAPAVAYAAPAMAYAAPAVAYAAPAYDDGKYYPGKYEKTIYAARPVVHYV